MRVVIEGAAHRQTTVLVPAGTHSVQPAVNRAGVFSFFGYLSVSTQMDIGNRTGLFIVKVYQCYRQSVEYALRSLLKGLGT